MKRVILSLIILVLACTSYGQSKPTEVTPDGYFTKPSYQYIFGSTSDTMTNADTTSFVYRVKGNETRDYNIELYLDHVSGTAAGNIITSRSMDGVNYTSTGDTIAFTGITGDSLIVSTITLNDFNFPYLKSTYIQSGTTVIVPKEFVIGRKN